MPQFQEKSILLSSERLSASYFRLVLSAPHITAQAKPGQFVMVACGTTLDPLLRRPFSIHRCPGDGSLHLLIKIVGKGSQLLADLAPGTVVDLLGPLGKGFTPQSALPAVLVGGGVGIAPLLFFVEHGINDAAFPTPPAVFLGAQTAADIRQLAEEFRQRGCAVTVATDDGSLGHHGLVTEPLQAALHQYGQAYVCGPTPMMAATAALCQSAGIACQVSLEAHMACGLGACLGCTVHAADGGYRHVCKHGPVMPAEEVAWIR